MPGSRLTLEKPHWTLLVVYQEDQDKKPQEMHFFPSWEKHKFDRHECWCEPNVGCFDQVYIYLHEALLEAIPPAEGVSNDAD